MRVLLVATYELGHQPTALAGPSARLRRAGHEVACLDLSIEPLETGAVDWADKVAVSVPMHTAMRLARQVVATVRSRRPEVPVCYYGLYALTAAEPDGEGGAGGGLGPGDAAIAGEVEPDLEAWVEGRTAGVSRRLARVPDRPSDRSGLAALERYARLVDERGEHLVGAVEASRGCSHRCRHCPVPVVYEGRVRPVEVADVLADVDQLVDAGAAHLTFADPDFLNAPRHARRVVAAVHRRHPSLTFDCTVKVEHVLRHAGLWPELAAAGCRFVVSAFESTNDRLLALLRKGHTVEEASAAVALLRRHGIEMRPSWLPFTPWTSAGDVADLVDFVLAHDLVANVDPVQYSVRLLVPPGSLLLDDPELAAAFGSFDVAHLGYTWEHPDPSVDALQRELAALVEDRAADPAEEVFGAVEALVRAAAGRGAGSVAGSRSAGPPGCRPRLTETWFCCSEPTAAQLAPVALVTGTPLAVGPGPGPVASAPGSAAAAGAGATPVTWGPAR
ncbi:MAG: CUAEP/CCAEP-tail radical SAM protein [Actinomycetota bacterium]|nr:CUAEP/CCAEP-tail radical SAM protein [Actinomycetota bacterium]